MYVNEHNQIININKEKNLLILFLESEFVLVFWLCTQWIAGFLLNPSEKPVI